MKDALHSRRARKTQAADLSYKSPFMNTNHVSLYNLSDVNTSNTFKDNSNFCLIFWPNLNKLFSFILGNDFIDFFFYEDDAKYLQVLEEFSNFELDRFLFLFLFDAIVSNYVDR